MTELNHGYMLPIFLPAILFLNQWYVGVRTEISDHNCAGSERLAGCNEVNFTVIKLVVGD